MSVAIQKASESLVDRARQGDQNAVALICQVRENRKKGNPKAAIAYDYMMSYVNKRPAKKQDYFGCCHETSFSPLVRAKEAKGLVYGKTLVKFVLDMGQSIDDSRLAAYILATGRPIDRKVLRSVLACTPSPIRPAFGQGYRDPNGSLRQRRRLSPEGVKCLQLGYILGVAKRVQDIQDSKVPLGTLSPMIAWELGE